MQHPWRNGYKDLTTAVIGDFIGSHGPFDSRHWRKTIAWQCFFGQFLQLTAPSSDGPSMTDVKISHPSSPVIRHKNYAALSTGLNTLCSEKNTDSRFLLYFGGKRFNLYEIFRVRFWGELKVENSLLLLTRKRFINFFLLPWNPLFTNM